MGMSNNIPSNNQHSVEMQSSAAISVDIKTTEAQSIQAVDPVAKVDRSFEELKQQIQNMDEIKSLIKDFNQRLDANVSVHFSKDDASNKFIINVIDDETNQSVKQYPSEEIVNLAVRIQDYLNNSALKLQSQLDNQHISTGSQDMASIFISTDV